MKKIITILTTLILSLTFANVSHAQHYVQRGESLSSIALKHGMTLKDLISLNPHIANPNKIKPNDYIIIRSKVETQGDLTAYARSLSEITAYKYGGQNFPTSTDCSGWTQGVFAKFGIKLPRTAAEQARTGKPVTFSELQVGDLLFFSTRADKKITHVGIKLDNDFWISNLNEKKDVEIMSDWGPWTQKYFMWGARHKM